MPRQYDIYGIEYADYYGLIFDYDDGVIYIDGVGIHIEEEEEEEEDYSNVIRYVERDIIRFNRYIRHEKNSVTRYVDDDGNVIRNEEISAARIEDYDGNVIRYEEPRLYVGYEDNGIIKNHVEPYLSIENDKEKMLAKLTKLIKLEHPKELLKHMTEGDIKKLAEKDLEEYYLRYHLRTKSQEKSS